MDEEVVFKRAGRAEGVGSRNPIRGNRKGRLSRRIALNWEGTSRAREKQAPPYLSENFRMT